MLLISPLFHMYRLKNTSALLICCFVIICGYTLGYFLSDTAIFLHGIKNIPSSVLTFKIEVFCNIFFKNLLVGLSIAIIGFLTSGFAAIIILFWNGMMIGSFLKTYQISDSIIHYFAYHGIFEITAFLCLGMFGLQGISFYVNLFRNNKYDLIFQKEQLIYPFILLIIAGIIESLLISNFV
ncbi:Integral membrane protein DUF95 [Bacteroides heparinolyticus]|uniref:Integral membrane protein DUF95 n=1 Tax=Prevotella heparinolytica TaxID=28113 RepID=A0A449I2D4_9BACE|nr:stage II sporulation protein M [Bacteroides heparinolyticus]VFB13566.1 Integral membrane protein DUF95 [Bacteroides heparinolyticus]